jgi:hypothetical protein
MFGIPEEDSSSVAAPSDSVKKRPDLRAGEGDLLRMTIGLRSPADYISPNFSSSPIGSSNEHEPNATKNR